MQKIVFGTLEKCEHLFKEAMCKSHMVNHEKDLS